MGRKVRKAAVKAARQQVALAEKAMIDAIALKMAGWLEAALITLQEDFEFTPGQIRRFADGLHKRLVNDEKPS